MRLPLLDCVRPHAPACSRTAGAPRCAPPPSWRPRLVLTHPRSALPCDALRLRLHPQRTGGCYTGNWWRRIWSPASGRTPTLCAPWPCTPPATACSPPRWTAPSRSGPEGRRASAGESRRLNAGAACARGHAASCTPRLLCAGASPTWNALLLLLLLAPLLHVSLDLLPLFHCARTIFEWHCLEQAATSALDPSGRPTDRPDRPRGALAQFAWLLWRALPITQGCRQAACPAGSPSQERCPGQRRQRAPPAAPPPAHLAHGGRRHVQARARCPWPCCLIHHTLRACLWADQRLPSYLPACPPGAGRHSAGPAACPPAWPACLPTVANGELRCQPRRPWRAWFL